jgi:hypothetical protein
VAASDFRDRVLKWVAAATAVISLILGGQKLIDAENAPFSSITDVVMPMLDRAMLDEHHPRRADVLAHAGWAMFLKSRDSVAVADPRPLWEQAIGFYKRAIAVDHDNPYANAMLGHLRLWRRADPVDVAMPYFSAALATGKERAYVRRTQIVALRNGGSDASDSELMKVGKDVGKQGDPIETASARAIYGVYRFR